MKSRPIIWWEAPSRCRIWHDDIKWTKLPSSSAEGRPSGKRYRHGCRPALALIAGTFAEHYVKEGAVLTEPETLKLNNPSPLTIRINNYQQCSEEPIICFKNRGVCSPVLYEELWS
uniref:Phlebovirus glycoprotein G2 fusion domain-containing protein n=1 Tax=Panagrellus redivivus TaxID=6233 RepID=A0A7E4VEE9_PANRE